jgi:hypothetical protein
VTHEKQILFPSDRFAVEKMLAERKRRHFCYPARHLRTFKQSLLNLLFISMLHLSLVRFLGKINDMRRENRHFSEMELMHFWLSNNILNFWIIWELKGHQYADLFVTVVNSAKLSGSFDWTSESPEQISGTGAFWRNHRQIDGIRSRSWIYCGSFFWIVHRWFWA